MTKLILNTHLKRHNYPFNSSYYHNMKRTLLFVGLALICGLRAVAQDDVTPVVHTKALESVIADAREISTSTHYLSGQDELTAAIAEAEGKLGTFADDYDVREAIKALQAAIDAIVEANSGDATSKVNNPSFDKDGNNSTSVTGWTVSNFKQNRRSVTYESTSTTSMTNFVEQWASAAVLANPKGEIYQEVAGLPAGHYRLMADVLAITQKTDTLELEGLQLYAGENAREIGLSGVNEETQAVNYGVEADLAEGETLRIGLRFDGINTNWLALDNIRLYYIGDASEFNKLINAEKLAAAKEVLQARLDEARALAANDNAPLYRPYLLAAIEDVATALDSDDLETVEQATTRLAEEVSIFNSYNKHYSDLQKAIAAAEQTLTDAELTVGREEFEAALATARTQLAEATSYEDDEATAVLDRARENLTLAESHFRVLNASYEHPANVITNGKMSSTDGWDILVPGSNPGLHINTSGDVTNFSKPFMECWVNNTDYGQENYAQQTVEALPDGNVLPAGYYVLRAAALATRQDQAGVQVNGVQLRLAGESVDVHTANGVAQWYQLGYDMKTAGEAITFGLYIDAATNANWIAWDEVELQYVGDKDTYLKKYTEALLGEHVQALRDEVAKARELLNSVDAGDVDVDDYVYVIEDAEYTLENLLNVTVADLDGQVEALKQAEANFLRSGVSPRNGQYFDFTDMIQNPDFDVDGGAGWQVGEGDGENAAQLPAGTDLAYWWFGSSGPASLVQDIYQTLNDMPAGNYLMLANITYRIGMTYRVDEYQNPTNYVPNCCIYANYDSLAVKPVFYVDEERGLTLENMLALTNDYDYRGARNGFPNDLLHDTEHNYYLNRLSFNLEEAGDIVLGFHVEVASKNGSMPFLDSFRLYYYGNQEVPAAGVTAASQSAAATAAVFNLSGQRVGRSTETRQLPKGIYIIGNRKVVIR